MAGNVRLKHTTHEADKTLYFYEGEADVKKGVVSIPKDRPEWIRRAWVLGYRNNTKGEPYRIEDLIPLEVISPDKE